MPPKLSEPQDAIVMGEAWHRKQFDSIESIVWKHLWKFLQKSWGDMVHFAPIINFFQFSSVLKVKKSDFIG